MKKIKQNTSNGVNKKIIFLTIFAAFLLIPFISKAAVVINEVLYDPSSSTDTGKEYIILYNNGGSPYIMDSHCLYASDKHYIFKSFTLEPKKQIIIHWNTEGTDTSTDLYTGTTNWSNMGNSSGSVALFLNHTEHESSIIDFIRYHAAGSTENKTWESAAAKAGIWAKGDFIPDVDAGYAIKLKTDGLDNNSSNDWMSATPSITQEESSSSQQQSATQQISANSQPPVADAGDDVIAFIGDEITFDGSKSYDPDGFDLACEWNLGEGGVENDVAVTHKYSYPGTYLVTLTVFDGKYYVSDTITIEIYPKKITINEFLPSPTGKDEEEEWIVPQNSRILV